MKNLDSLIVLDGIRGISHADALAFLDGKRGLLDSNSTVADYLSLASEYASIGETKTANELIDMADQKAKA